MRDWRWWLNEVSMVTLALLCLPIVVVGFLYWSAQDWTDPYFDKHD